MTHTDPKAETAALAVAVAAALSMGQSRSAEALLAGLSGLGTDDEWKEICRKLTAALTTGRSVSEFADELGLRRGVTGYAYHSVPVALYAWLRHPDDFRTALIAVLNCGEDTDTVGAILGALTGARLGRETIPPEWLEGICDHLRSVRLMIHVAERLVQQLTSKQALGPVRYFWPWLAVDHEIGNRDGLSLGRSPTAEGAFATTISDVEFVTADTGRTRVDGGQRRWPSLAYR